ncbi:MAG: LacI family DNA-binding transcriptional regulator [Cyclobacteriaceae bacterium]
MKKGNITIKDIAQELNISISTVSRALADNPLVKLSTREAVKKLAKTYNYKPNFTALSLRHSKTKTIGVIVPQIVHEFFALVIRGIEDRCYAAGYNVIVCSSHEDYEREVVDARAMLTGRVDGVLACVSRTTDNYDHFKEFEERNIPIGFFDCICPDMQTHRVIIDDIHAGYIATDHLVKSGCRKIAYIGGSEHLKINHDRRVGYEKALRDHGIAIVPNFIQYCETTDFEEGINISESWIKNKEIDGVFAAADMLAIASIKNMKKHGLACPDDIKVVGFSNWSISSIYEPSISTIDQPGYEMGYKSAELLLNQINEPEATKFETVVLATELIHRESS